MKKFASVLLAVLVAFSMFSFVVSAAGVTFTVNADKTTVNAGDTVKVTVSIPENAGLATLQVALKYDAEAFKVKGATPGGLYGFEEVNASTGFYTSAASTPPTKGGVLFTVELEALKATDSEISIVVSEATDNEYNDVTVTSNKVAIKGFVEAPVDPTEPTNPVDPTDPTDPTEPEDPCKDGHNYSEYIVTKKACANQAGEKQRTCKVCGNIEKEAIAKNGKCEPGAWKVVKAATTTAEGEKVQECKICGEVLQRAKIAKLPSNPITNPAIPNTDAQA
ncbi:MAG: hypothetical protein IJA80_07865 [Clostridia bacterium]|nr:hypothetical protein [Clostridia bacterium]MBQ4645511.1 hypothetical protein [Clostridia bacterium]